VKQALCRRGAVRDRRADNQSGNMRLTGRDDWYPLAFFLKSNEGEILKRLDTRPGPSRRPAA
jgi:hypothetical protein